MAPSHSAVVLLVTGWEPEGWGLVSWEDSRGDLQSQLCHKAAGDLRKSRLLSCLLSYLSDGPAPAPGVWPEAPEGWVVWLRLDPRWHLSPCA